MSNVTKRNVTGTLYSEHSNQRMMNDWLLYVLKFDKIQQSRLFLWSLMFTFAQKQPFFNRDITLMVGILTSPLWCVLTETYWSVMPLSTSTNFQTNRMTSQRTYKHYIEWFLMKFLKRLKCYEEIILSTKAWIFVLFFVQ